MDCAWCHKGLEPPVTVVNGQVAHADPCAVDFRRSIDEEAQKEHGVRRITTWASRWTEDEYGIYHEDEDCPCPECSADRIEKITETRPDEEGIDFDNG